MRKLVIGLVAALLILGMVSVAAYAQGTGSLREYTGYQVMNLAQCQGCVAHVRVDYYNAQGVIALTKNLPDIPPGGSANVQQKTEEGLADGVYSAVLSSDQPIAAVVGQIEADPLASGLTYFAPFSNYTGASAGSSTVVLPSLGANWFGLDSLVRIQNAGDAAAEVTIQYYATRYGTNIAGRETYAPVVRNIPRYAAITIDQAAAVNDLAAQAGIFSGKFFGSAVITSNQPLVAIVNETVVAQRLKFTYNGFGTDDAGNELLAPAIFSKWFNTLTSMSIQNTSTTNSVDVTITYTAGAGSLLANGNNATGDVTTINVTLGPGASTTRYEGDANGDLYNKYRQFGGSARIAANGPIVAKINQTSYTAVNNRNPSGAYNAVPVNKLTTRVAAPLIQADFYTYFTSLTCANSSTSQAAQITINYTSDNNSDRANVTGSVNHTIPAGGSIIRYEAARNGTLADINKSGSPWDLNGRARFNGSAFITSSGPAIACTVNEVGGSVTNDNMNTYNGISLTGN